jgi:hypothetical protein
MQVTNALLVGDFKKDLEKFFDVTISDISICICNPEEFKPFKFADYVMAYTITIPNLQIVFILDEKYTNYSHEEWLKVVKHELVHLFFSSKFKSGNPRWLNEGLACYLSGQEKPLTDVTFDDLIKYNNSTDEKIYSVGYTLVKKLLDKGKNAKTKSSNKHTS